MVYVSIFFVFIGLSTSLIQQSCAQELTYPNVLKPNQTDTKVSFTKIPEVFKVGHTRTMSMRCDIKPSDSKLKSVTSLAIVRGDSELVAKVSISDAAKALADLSSLKVEGNVSEKTTELDYIELIWENPSEKLIGIYACLVKAVNSDGHDVTMSSILEIREPTPTIDQLVNRMRELKRDIQTERTTRQRELQNEKESAKTELVMVKESTQTQIYQLKESITELEREKNVTEAQNVLILKDLASLQSQVIQSTLPRHVEIGSASCDNTTRLLRHQKGLYESVDYLVEINFKTPYAKPPLVMHAISLLQLSGMQNSKGAVRIDKVDENGFSAICHTWAGSHVYYNMHFTWMSISTDE